MSDELEQLNPYERLDPIYQVAINLRLEFLKYKYIAKKLGRTEGTIAKWFMAGGECYEGFKYMEQKRKEESQEMFKKVRAQLEALTPEALLVLQHAMTKKDARTALEILAINGIAPTQKLEIDVNNKEKVDAVGAIIKEFTNDKSGADTKNKDTAETI